MIFIRADANSAIAMGHIMRCMAIAKQLKNQGENVIFLVADNYAAGILDENGYEYIILNTDWKNMDTEIPLVKKLILEYKVRTLFIDSYQVTEHYFSELNNAINMIYLDDRNAFKYCVSGVINYSHYYKELEYEKVYAGSEVKLWLGCEYIPLRDEFCNAQKKSISEQIENVIITTGGTDAFHVSECILKMFSQKFPKINFHVAVGRFFKSLDNLKELEEKNKNVILHENVKKMSDLMNKCDVAFSAGGTTLYELCAMGVPTICFSIADNQSIGVRCMESQNIMLSAGDIRNGQDVFEKKLESCFKTFQKRNIRDTYSKRMQSLVDGKGAERIAEQLIHMTERKC